MNTGRLWKWRDGGDFDEQEPCSWVPGSLLRSAPE